MRPASPTHRGAVSRTNLYLVMAGALLLVMVPPTLVPVGPLRSNGSPARLIGLVCFAVVFIGLVAGARLRIRTVAVPSLIAFLVGLLISYGVGNVRVLLPEEQEGATRQLLLLVAALGSALLMALTLQSYGAVRLVFAALAVGLIFSAIVGLVQNVLVFNYAGLIRPPGWTTLIERDFGQRGDLRRVIGAAGNPIEYAVLLGASAPIVFHLARYALTPMSRLLWRAGLATVIIAIPLAVSRSGIIALAISMGIYAIRWTTRQRLIGLAWAAVGVVALAGLNPRVFTTFLFLFLSFDEDPSVEGRTDDYAIVGEFFSRNPLFGRGLGTFTSDIYILLDNQWLGTLVETGLFGALLLLVLFIIFICLGLGRLPGHQGSVARASVDLRAALGGCALALAVSGLTFDLFSFQQPAMLVFLVFGGIGALVEHHRKSTAET